MADFERYATAFFRKCAPTLMRRLSKEDQADVQREIVLHCIDDNFRVLRQFRETGSNFDAWFCTVCMNKTKDFVKRETRYQQILADELRPTGDPESSTPAGLERPDEIAAARRLIAQVNQCIEVLDRHCRLLIRMSGEEFKPLEIVRVLRWPASKAKKVSDDLRYCKERLRKLLAERGVI